MKIAVAAAAAHLECAQRSLDAWTRDGDLATLQRLLSECESKRANQCRYCKPDTACARIGAAGLVPVVAAPGVAPGAACRADVAR